MDTAQNQNIVDSSMETFGDDVINASAEQLVMVDFWADWCGPCKQLTPILEKLVAQYDGQLKLVKIDTEQHQEIAAQFGIRSLPTVFFFYKGQPVDQFMGVQPEQAIREKIDKYLVNESEAMLQQATAAYEGGQKEAALQFVQQLIQSDPGNEPAKLLLLSWLCADNRMEDAKFVAEAVSEESKNSKEFKSYEAKLEFAENFGETGDIGELQTQVEADPSNLETRFQLALALISSERYEEGMDHILEIIRADRTFRDEEPRKMLIKVFEMLGGKGEVVSKYRSMLGTVLN